MWHPYDTPSLYQLSYHKYNMFINKKHVFSGVAHFCCSNQNCIHPFTFKHHCTYHDSEVPRINPPSVPKVSVLIPGAVIQKWIWGSQCWHHEKTRNMRAVASIYLCWLMFLVRGLYYPVYIWDYSNPRTGNLYKPTSKMEWQKDLFHTAHLNWTMKFRDFTTWTMMMKIWVWVCLCTRKIASRVK